MATNADLTDADLTNARLDDANLQGAILNRTTLSGAHLEGALFGFTILVNLNLGEASGLQEVKHTGPSSIGLDTLCKSSGRIPAEFLRGVGVPEDVIQGFLPHLRNL